MLKRLAERKNVEEITSKKKGKKRELKKKDGEAATRSAKADPIIESEFSES